MSLDDILESNYKFDKKGKVIEHSLDFKFPMKTKKSADTSVKMDSV